MSDPMPPSRLLLHDQFVPLLAPAVDRVLWTALIPAAGHGSRLQFERPKILFPIGGKTILEWLVRLLQPFCSHFIFVLNPEGAAVVEPELASLLPGRYAIALQPQPCGMADAVARGVPLVSTSYTVVIWGDQVALKPASIDFCMRLQQGSAAPAAVCPTLLRARPYTHFQRDESGRITRVLQAREGDAMPEIGENDAGVFFFPSDILAQYAESGTTLPACRGARTGESNFLPLLAAIDSTHGSLFTPRIMSEEESIGVNTREDGLYLEQRLRERAVSKQHDPLVKHE